MKKKTYFKKKRPATKDIDIQQEITNRIINDLEAGKLPWDKPWMSSLPMNLCTKKPYRGVNVLVLMSEAAAHGYKSQYWLTYKQAVELGGTVRKGERGTHVVFNQPFIKETEKEDGETTERKLWLMRYYTVFNADQVDGIEKAVEKFVEEELEEIPDAEKTIKATKARIEFGGDRACYTPTLDYILMPPKNKFKSQVGYYGTVFHELVHWTGHEKRLKRDVMNSFGSEKYAEEELVAEMGAAFICAAHKIKYTAMHAAYVANWLKVLKDDKRAIFKAAGLAQKAMDFILKTKVEIAEPKKVKGDEPLKQESA